MSDQPAAPDRRPLATLLTANVISLTGSSLSLIAVPLFVLQTSGSAGKTGIVAFCATLPVVISAVFGGPVIDRLGRWRVSACTDLVAAAAMAAIPLLHAAGLLAFWGLCLLVAVSGFFLAPGETSRSVLMPHLADRAGLSLGRVAGFYESARQLARLVGAPLAGLLVAILGPSQVLLLDAGTDLASALLVTVGLRKLPAAAPVRDAPRVDLARYGSELREGFAYVRGTRLLLAVVLMVTVSNAFNQGWSAVLMPVHAERDLGGSFDLGVIAGRTGGGALIGSLVYGAFGDRLPRRPVYTIAFRICGLPRFLIAAFVPGLAPLAAFMLLEGAAAGTLNPILTP
ncbi:MAG: MFS transporter, partial [Kitasatospora sp.]|nr:MFS transporter [Kitasatospora sp.]